jgi:hypothetical protein
MPITARWPAVVVPAPLASTMHWFWPYRATLRLAPDVAVLIAIPSTSHDDAADAGTTYVIGLLLSLWTSVFALVMAALVVHTS